MGIEPVWGIASLGVRHHLEISKGFSTLFTLITRVKQEDIKVRLDILLYCLQNRKVLF